MGFAVEQCFQPDPEENKWVFFLMDSHRTSMLQSSLLVLVFSKAFQLLQASFLTKPHVLTSWLGSCSQQSQLDPRSNAGYYPTGTPGLCSFHSSLEIVTADINFSMIDLWLLLAWGGRDGPNSLACQPREVGQSRSTPFSSVVKIQH